jgi:periplasmic protein TonB
VSELAASGASSRALFAAGWHGRQLGSGVARARPTAIVVSLVVHLVALLAGAVAWHPRAPVGEQPMPSVRVTMLRPPKLPRPVAALTPAPAPAPAVPRRARPTRLLPPQPAAELLPKPEPDPTPVSESSDTTAPDAGAATLVTAEIAAVLGGGGGVASSDEPAETVVEVPPPISPERRQEVLASYLREVFRSRIAAHFQYPEEAERLGMEGLVVVRASVLPTGALWSARIIGPCPQRILCAAAERTVRAAAPFPPPPTELGGAISIDVPLNYRLE